MSHTYVPGSAPYPWPWNGSGLGDWAVLVIDSAGLRPADGLAERIAPFITRLNQAGCPAIRVRVGGARPGRRGAVRSDRAVLAVPDRWPAPAEFAETIEAPGWNGFDQSSLDTVLRAAGRNTLLLTGFWLETGVHSTLRAANDRGYECATVEDLCSAWDPGLQGAALSSIQFSGGIFGAVVSSQAVVSSAAVVSSEAVVSSATVVSSEAAICSGAVISSGAAVSSEQHYQQRQILKAEER